MQVDTGRIIGHVRHGNQQRRDRGGNAEEEAHKERNSKCDREKEEERKTDETEARDRRTDRQQGQVHVSLGSSRETHSKRRRRAREDYAEQATRGVLCQANKQQTRPPPHLTQFRPASWHVTTAEEDALLSSHQHTHDTSMVPHAHTHTPSVRSVSERAAVDQMIWSIGSLLVRNACSRSCDQRPPALSDGVVGVREYRTPEMLAVRVSVCCFQLYAR